MTDKERIQLLEQDLRVKNEQLKTCIMVLEQLEAMLKIGSFYKNIIIDLLKRLKP